MQPSEFSRSRLVSYVRTYAMRGVIAISAMAIVALGIILVSRGERLPQLQTQAGEQRELELSDGSIVVLNSDSILQTKMNRYERQIYLLKGEARFHVAKDATRPFTVHTPNAQARALGTIFNVQAAGRSTGITVVEGRVEVAGADALHGESLLARILRVLRLSPPASDRRMILEAGQHALVTTTGDVVPDSGPTVAMVNAWPHWLRLTDTKLAKLLAVLNRYRSQPIVIADPELVKIQFSGIVNVYDPAALLEYLTEQHRVRVQQMPDGRILLARKTS